MDRIIAFFDKPMLINMILILSNTLILYAIVHKLLYKPVIEFMNKRSENIKESMESAKKQEQEALELKRKLHIELKKIENEKKMILDKFQTLGKQRKEEIVKEAIEDAKNIKKRALDDIMHEEFKAKENIKAQIIDLSFLIASRFISKNIEDDDSLKLLDDALVILEEINYV